MSILCSKLNVMLKTRSFWLVAPFSNDLPKSRGRLKAFLLVQLSDAETRNNRAVVGPLSSRPISFQIILKEQCAQSMAAAAARH